MLQKGTRLVGFLKKPRLITVWSFPLNLSCRQRLHKRSQRPVLFLASFERLGRTCDFFFKYPGVFFQAWAARGSMHSYFRMWVGWESTARSPGARAGSPSWWLLSLLPLLLCSSHGGADLSSRPLCVHACTCCLVDSEL